MMEMQKEEIDGVTYEVAMLPARASWRLLQEILRAIAPPLGVLLGEVFDDAASLKGIASKVKLKIVGDSDSDSVVGGKNLSGKILEQAIAALMKSTGPDFIDELTDQMAKVTIVTGTEAGGKLDKIFDHHFMGKMSSLTKWLAFALRVQYADFFDE